MGVSLAFRHVLDLVFPMQCAGCRKWDTDLCSQCAALATKHAQIRFLEDATGVPYAPLVALGGYEGALRNIVLSAKHNPDQNLSGFLAAAGRTLGGHAGLSLKEASERSRMPVERVWVIGAPPSHVRKWKRMEVVPSIVKGVVEGVEQAGFSAQVMDAVALRWWGGSQAGKSESERRLGRGEALKLVAKPKRGEVAIIVDDVVTTGATMRQMATLLHPHVLCAVALAAAV